MSYFIFESMRMLKWEDPNKTYFKERFSIFNAYYLPRGGTSKLYPTITPVNTFRIILNYYFGMNYKVLEDKSYFSTWNHPYKFIDVTDAISLTDAKNPFLRNIPTSRK